MLVASEMNLAVETTVYLTPSTVTARVSVPPAVRVFSVGIRIARIRAWSSWAIE